MTMKKEKKNESTVEKYILDRTMHFGFLKETFRVGNVFDVDFTGKCMSVEGVKYEDVRDATICIRKGWLKPYSQKEKERISVISDSIDKSIETSFPKAKPAKMLVVKSDSDLMEREIKIVDRFKKPEAKKKGDMTVVREDTGDSIRGITVVRQSDDSGLAQQLNAEVMFPATSSLNKNVKVATKPVAKVDEVAVKQKLAERKQQVELARKAKKE